MLNRIRESLVAPQELIKYYKDGLFKALLYVLFFAVIASLPVMIQVMTFEGVSNQLRRDVMSEIEPLQDDCEIIDARLMCENEVNHTFFTIDRYRFSLSSHAIENINYESNYIHFILHEDKIVIYGRSFMGPVKIEESILSLNPLFHDFDLNTLESHPELFEYVIFETVNEALINTRAVWGTMLVLSAIFGNLVLFLVFILINAFFIRARLPVIPYKPLFTLVSYAGTTLYLVFALYGFWNFDFLILLLLLFAAFRQMNRLTTTLQKRIYRQ